MQQGKLSRRKMIVVFLEYRQTHSKFKKCRAFFSKYRPSVGTNKIKLAKANSYWTLTGESTSDNIYQTS